MTFDAPACSGKMNNIVKNYKDYCMDIISVIRIVAGILADWSVKKGGVERHGG